MAANTGFTIPYKENLARTSGRNFSDHTIEESRDGFMLNLVVEFQRRAVDSNDPFFVHIMPIVYYRGNGTRIHITTFSIKAVAYDPRPLGVSAQSTTQSATEYMVDMERFGLKLKYNTDSLQTPEGRDQFKNRLLQFQQAGINTIMAHGMAAINNASKRDAMSLLQLQITRSELRDIQNLNTKRTRDLVGCINNSTGALKRAISTFNKIFSYYSGMTRFILMHPDTYAMLQHRPWAPDIPEYAVEAITTNRKVATGGAMAPSGHPDVSCILIPPIPRNSAGAMYNPMERLVYASTYMYFESPMPDTYSGAVDTYLAAYDTDNDTLTNISSKEIMDADPMLPPATQAAMLEPFTKCTDTACPANPLLDNNDGQFRVLDIHSGSRVPAGRDFGYRTDEAGVVREYGSVVEAARNHGAPINNLTIEKFRSYAESQSWNGTGNKKQHTVLPATASPWGISFDSIKNWENNPLRKQLWKQSKPLLDMISQGHITTLNRASTVRGTAVAVIDLIIRKEARRAGGGAAWAVEANPIINDVAPDKLHKLGVAIMWMEILYHALAQTGWGHADVSNVRNLICAYRAPHFLFLSPSMQTRILGRMQHTPTAKSNIANWSTGIFADRIRAMAPIPGVTFSEFAEHLGGTFDDMIEHLKGLNWTPASYVLVKPANVAVSYRMVFAAGELGQIFVRLDGTFEGVDVATNFGDIETAMHIGAVVTRRTEVAFLDNGHLKMEGPTIGFKLPKDQNAVRGFANKLKELVNKPDPNNSPNTPTMLAIPVSSYATGSNKLEAKFFKDLTAAVDYAKATTTANAKESCEANIAVNLAFAGFLAPQTAGTKGSGVCFTLDNIVASQDAAYGRGGSTNTNCVTRFDDPITRQPIHVLEPFSCRHMVGSREVQFLPGNCCFGIIKDRLTATQCSGLLGSGGGEVATTIQPIRQS